MLLHVLECIHTTQPYIQQPHTKSPQSMALRTNHFCLLVPFVQPQLGRQRGGLSTQRFLFMSTEYHPSRTALVDSRPESREEVEATANALGQRKRVCFVCLPHARRT